MNVEGGTLQAEETASARALGWGQTWAQCPEHCEEQDRSRK